MNHSDCHVDSAQDRHVDNTPESTSLFVNFLQRLPVFSGLWSAVQLENLAGAYFCKKRKKIKGIKGGLHCTFVCEIYENKNIAAYVYREGESGKFYFILFFLGIPSLFSFLFLRVSFCLHKVSLCVIYFV